MRFEWILRADTGIGTMGGIGVLFLCPMTPMIPMPRVGVRLL